MIRTALVVSSVLLVTWNVAPALQQGETPAAAEAPSLGNSAPAEIPKADIKRAISHIRRAWGSDAPCSRVERCATYFESFAAALTFNDGSIVPLAHEQRLKRSSHDCIQEARAAQGQGKRALAVQWVMAAYVDNPLTRNWLADHPDAVLEGLRRFGD